MTRAVVFAYHDVGARCLRVLHAHGIDVPLVVTHADDPDETQWFERVADVADDLALPWIAPVDVNASESVNRIATLAPDFLFSFYCRQMLKAPLLALAPRGALNMHGSLLPKYRGRAPVNWAVLHGERRTGATLHYMADKPDAGDIVAQQAVPILPDDTAREVFDKVTVAAEICLDAVLPALIAGTAPRYPNDIAHGSYFGRRTPADGRIDWQKSALKFTTSCARSRPRIRARIRLLAATRPACCERACWTRIRRRMPRTSRSRTARNASAPMPSSSRTVAAAERCASTTSRSTAARHRPPPCEAASELLRCRWRDPPAGGTHGTMRARLAFPAA